MAAVTEGVPTMEPWQGRVLYGHIRGFGAKDVLELGTFHGVSSAYMAAALDPKGGGKVTTVDRWGASDPSPEETLERAGVTERVELVRIPHSSYVWWLKEQVEAHSDEHGNCEPQYDFCFVDGAHNFTVDGMAVVLVERLLRPGGWLLLDDLGWSYDSSPTELAAPDGLSAVERSEPGLRAVFDIVLKQHPAFTDLRVENDWWGWARKAPGEPRKYRVGTTRRPTDILRDGLRSLRRRS